MRSRNSEDVIREVKRLAEHGFREIVLTGIHLSSYGVDTGDDLIHLIREVHKVLPDTAIWLGGPEVSYDARKVLEEHPEVPGVMKGEGVVTILELAG